MRRAVILASVDPWASDAPRVAWPYIPLAFPRRCGLGRNSPSCPKPRRGGGSASVSSHLPVNWPHRILGCSGDVFFCGLNRWSCSLPDQKQKIIVVDDDPDIRRLVETVLERDGFIVDTAAAGAEFFKKLPQYKPDLVVLDLQLPDEDGFGIIKKLRANPNTANLPVVMLTVQSVDSYKIAGLEIGADDYIVKPFNQGEFVARIRAVLRRTKPKDQSTGLIDDGAIKLYLDQHRLEIDKKAVDLSPKEFDLLAALMRVEKHRSHARGSLRIRVGPRAGGQHAHRGRARRPAAQEDGQVRGADRDRRAARLPLPAGNTPTPEGSGFFFVFLRVNRRRPSHRSIGRNVAAEVSPTVSAPPVRDPRKSRRFRRGQVVQPHAAVAQPATLISAPFPFVQNAGHAAVPRGRWRPGSGRSDPCVRAVRSVGAWRLQRSAAVGA